MSSIKPYRTPVPRAHCCVFQRLTAVSAQWADATSHGGEGLADRLIDEVEMLENRLIGTQPALVDAAVAARLERLHLPGEGATLDPPCMKCRIRSVTS